MAVPLNTACYPNIEQRMLNARFDAPDFQQIRMGEPGAELQGAACALEVEGFGLYEEAAKHAISFDVTFSRQMTDVLEDNPKLFLVTASSAIPVADSIRGFYYANGLPAPSIDLIRADRSRAQNFSEAQRSKDTTRSFVEEVNRLRETYEGIGNVCVVDQLVSTGQTLKYAAALLKAAGMAQGTAMRGFWYTQANPEDLDYTNLTSKHADFMHDVGFRAAGQPEPTMESILAGLKAQ